MLQIISMDDCTTKDLYDKLVEFFSQQQKCPICLNCKTNFVILKKALVPLPKFQHTKKKPFPSFLEAKNMLLLHESHEASTKLPLDTVSIDRPFNWLFTNKQIIEQGINRD